LGADTKPTVGIFGAGWVGLVTGACFAEIGYRVVIRDIVPEKIERLRAGKPPFHEAELTELLERNRDRMVFTLDVEELASDAEFLFVCVDTPPTYAGDADLSRVWTVVDELPRLERRAILVMKSTVPVGTGEKVRAGLETRGLDIGYVSNPEFLAEGRAVADFMNPDRIVIGAFEEDDGDAVEALYEPIEAPIVRSDVNSAEMIKLAANAFLMTRISFINEIANVCEATGADVVKVAEGVGLDHRLGPHFLRAGLGWGGSCLAGEETILIRHNGRTRLISLADLFAEFSDDPEVEVVTPQDLEVLSWSPGVAPAFLYVAALTRRRYRGEMVDVRTKMGRRLRCTADHPFVVADGAGEQRRVKLAGQLTTQDWLPIATGVSAAPTAAAELDILGALREGDVAAAEIIARADREELRAFGARAVAGAVAAVGRARRPTSRSREIIRGGALRLEEAEALGLARSRLALATTTNGTYVPSRITVDEEFWRVVGLYVAEGHVTPEGSRRRIYWSFHPRHEFDLVEELLRYWGLRGVKALMTVAPTSVHVVISSRLLATWWLRVLGLGRTCYEQRLPDLIWEAPTSHKRALLSGLWRGDGSWSLLNGGPSVALEYGTVSRELADGILRLLGDLGIVARLKVGQTAKSTCDTYWLVISGADQVEQLLECVRPDDVPLIKVSLALQKNRIAPTGYRAHESGTWVRVVKKETESVCDKFVYSLEVPSSETFVTTHGLVSHNCFPKDSLALKQLAANSGYHFQLLSAVIEVNDLQKRRVIGKLKRHLGALGDTTVALLGLAFKAGTNDLREAPSLVLASQLLAEGVEVRAWDPVADARKLIHGATFCDTVADAVRGADAAVIVTEWPELRDLARPEIRDSMRRPLIIDGRNLLDPAEARAAGFAYEGIGRPTSPLDVLPETPERLDAPNREHA
jgi:UDPglucose 6-dehydrogenase